jgi:hypothetical protein
MKYFFIICGFLHYYKIASLFVGIRTLEYFPDSRREAQIRNGCDDRPNKDLENETEMRDTFLKIKKYINQSDLLEKLNDPNIGIPEKMGHIELYKQTFGENEYVYNITAGGLWNDFFSDILI